MSLAQVSLGSAAGRKGVSPRAGLYPGTMLHPSKILPAAGCRAPRRPLWHPPSSAAPSSAAPGSHTCVGKAFTQGRETSTWIRESQGPYLASLLPCATHRSFSVTWFLCSRSFSSLALRSSFSLRSCSHSVCRGNAQDFKFPLFLEGGQPGTQPALRHHRHPEARTGRWGRWMFHPCLVLGWPLLLGKAPGKGMGFLWTAMALAKRQERVALWRPSSSDRWELSQATPSSL